MIGRMFAHKQAFAALVSIALAALPTLVLAQSSTTGVTIPGVTQPLRTQYAKLSLSQSGSILEVNVKPGDAVKKGQLLVRQDDRLELVRLKALELEANSTAKVDEAIANLEVKQSVLKRKEAIFATQAGAASEVEEARLDMIDAEARKKIAELDVAKAKADSEGERVKIDMMRMLAPFDGIVEAVDVSVGEVSDPTKPLCTIVQNNPLWVEIRNMPDTWAGKIKLGDKLEVRYDERYAGTPIYDQKWVQAQVVFKSPVADAQSKTQLVRLVMPNTNNLDSGLDVVVRLPDSVTNPAAAPAAAARP